MNRVPVFERNFSLVDTYGADEAFLTGTFGAQTPVSEIDGRPIGRGAARSDLHADPKALCETHSIAGASPMDVSDNVLKPVKDRTLRAQITRQILDMVTSGNYFPGEKLTENALAEQLQVSRAPLREALRELVDRGVLVSQPYKGLRVRPVSGTDLKELYSLRTELEQFAFRLAWNNRNKEAIRGS